MLIPGCKLLARHVALGLSGETSVLRHIPDAFAMILRQVSSHNVVEQLTQAVSIPSFDTSNKNSVLYPVMEHSY